MSKERKDLIDDIDEDDEARLDMESMVGFLKDEIDQLKFTINEQKILIQEVCCNC